MTLEGSFPSILIPYSSSYFAFWAREESVTPKSIKENNIFFIFQCIIVVISNYMVTGQILRLVISLDRSTPLGELPIEMRPLTYREILFL